ncbi:hypothetical protein C8Q75DRAFT_736260 [Abortiporus biennis]|nr:hypothetical protein C8Q75DRAFT_736260 [Abortiporus biennis]
MSSCITTPTATQFTTITSESVSTSLSTIPITPTPVVTSSTTTICSTISQSSGLPSTSCSTSVITQTIGGSPTDSVVQVPVTVTVTQTSPTATLFQTVCNSNPTDTNTDTSISTTPTPTSTTTSTTATTTSPPSTFLSVDTSSSTLANGSVVVVSRTEVVTATSTTTQAPSSGSGTNVGAIAGGTVGGVVGFAILLLLFWWCIRRRERKKSMDEILFPEDKFDPTPVHHRRRLEKGARIDGGRPESFDLDPITDGAGAAILNTSLPTGNANMRRFSANPSEVPLTSHIRNPSASELEAVVGGYPPGHYRDQPSVPVGGTYPPTSSRLYGVAGTSPAIPNEAGSWSGTNVSSGNSHTPLVVANPAPNAAISAYPNDRKDPQIYLRADTGYEIRGGASGSGSSQAAGPSTPFVQHTDAGAVPVQAPTARGPFVQQDSPVPQPTLQQQEARQQQQQQPRRPSTPTATATLSSGSPALSSPQPRRKTTQPSSGQATDSELPPPAYSE